MSFNFRSDNESPAAPAVLEALLEANAGSAHSYGDDPYTARLQATFAELFETDVQVWPLATGTAANALAIAQLCPPYGATFCHEHAHLHTDECGAPEFFAGGAKLLPLPGAHAKIDADELARVLASAGMLGDHESMPAALSLSQATEFGAVYSLDELKALTGLAREHGLRIHMDGARFANAVASLDSSPAEVTWRAGVDMLSFGATKNGAVMAEALLVFNRDLADQLGRRRKRAGHLLSKMRFVSAQLCA
ncbi:MAG: beta-eliminating lyase-related protein, partial [Pseudomonadota bacterium]